MTDPPKKGVASVADEGGAAELAEYLRILRRYAWLIVLFIVASIGIAVAVTSRLPRVYDATCIIEYDPNPPRPLGEHVEDVAEPAADFWTTREFFQTQNHIIGSRLVAERVVERLGLNHDRTFVGGSQTTLPQDWEGIGVTDAALILQGRLSVEGMEDTRLVTIHVRDESPERGALIANTVADVFIEKTIEDRMSSTVTSLEWLGTQLDSLRQELERSERALHAFKQEHNILSVSLEDRQNLVAAELEHFSVALDAARTERIGRRAALARLRALRDADVGGMGAGFDDSATVSELQAALRAALAEREAQGLRYGSEHPQMQELDERIETLRQQVREQIDGLVTSAEADLREATDIEAGLQQAIDDANRAGLEVNLLEIEFTQLTRTRENNEKLYGVVLERTTETDLTRMLRTTHVRIVDRALAPTSTVSPRFLVNLGVGGGLGVLLGLLSAIALGRLDRRVKAPRDVEQQGLTLLGVVPKIEASETKPTYARLRRRSSRTPSGNFNPDVIAHTHPMSAIAENCRTIRTNLMFAGETPIRAICVSSPSPQEGKTTVTANLAISIAQSGKRVLIVDTDMRRPRVHRAFGVSGKRGLTSVIVGESSLEDATQDCGIPNVSVLACGPIPPNPAELLHRERFLALLAEAREKFDMVIFDTPPLSAVSDAAVLAPRLDGMLVVVRAERTTRDGIRLVLRQMADVGAHVIGGVLNGMDPRASGERDQYYYYGRGSYYGTEEEPKDPPPSASAGESEGTAE
jgi:capsular exopolysaccharide synthesis family protein